LAAVQQNPFSFVRRHSVCFHMTFVRSAVSILLGLAVFVVVVSALDALSVRLCPSCLSPDGAHVVSRPLLFGMLLYWSIAVIAAVWVTDRAAPRAPIVHSRIVTVVLMLFFGLNAGMAYLGGVDPVWWHQTLVVVSLAAGIMAGRASPTSSASRSR
jgi:hypothetical protein